MEENKKVILLTGASGGLGTEMSKYLSSKGYCLALHFNEHEIELPEGEFVQHFQADLSDTEQIKAMIDAVVAVFGGVDVVINNAGVSRNAMSWKVDDEDWDESIAINLSAPFFIIKHAVPHMRKKQFGRIINMTSVVGQTGFIGTSAYAASKSGLFGLTRTLSIELARFGITVNNFALGYFNTGMIEDVPDEMKKHILENVPMHKLGEPETIHAALDFVLSDGAHFYTGQTLNLNGGLFG
jgi:NAD(P)-dependent dehydrogenase (short-subunit alcohol dehydrogenase family)